MKMCKKLGDGKKREKKSIQTMFIVCTLLFSWIIMNTITIVFLVFPSLALPPLFLSLLIYEMYLRKNDSFFFELFGVWFRVTIETESAQLYDDHGHLTTDIQFALWTSLSFIFFGCISSQFSTSLLAFKTLCFLTFILSFCAISVETTKKFKAS